MRKKRHRGRRKKGNWFSRMSVAGRVAVCIAGILVCLITSTAVYAASKLGKLNTQKIEPEDIVINASADSRKSGYTTFACFGIDSREGELELGTRTDCIIIVSLNNRTKEVKMASVYRDTLLRIDSETGERAKCNAAYSYGGPTQAINMLNTNLDLDIQDYVTVDFAAIADAIDLLGGIDIDIKEEEIAPINKYVSETARVAGKEAREITAAGEQHLDGVQATTYARIRSTAGGDFTRTERQRLVIEKVVEKAQSSDLRTINSIIDTVFPKISTSLSATEILGYAKDFLEYKLTDSTGFPFAKTTDTISNLGSIVIPVNLDNNVEQLHQFLYEGESYTVSAEVQDVSASIINLVGPRTADAEYTENASSTTENSGTEYSDSTY